MLLDKLMQSSQMNELAATRETGRDNLRMRRNDETKSRETSFREILNGISEKEKKEETKPREVTLQDLKDKIGEIEKKIDQLSKNTTDEKKARLEEVKTTLEKVKQLLEGISSGDKNMRIDFGKFSMDFTLFLNNILGSILELLNKSNGKELKDLMQYLNSKIDEAQALIDPNAAVKNAIQSEGPVAVSADTADKTPGKVTIVDKRTDTAENSAANGMKKSAMTAEKSMLSGEQKLVKAEKAIEVSFQKVMDKDNAEILKNKDVLVNHMNKNAANSDVSVQNKTASMAGTSVSRAGMEALFQNMAGRLSVTLRDGKSEFKMNLTPPELGHMRMKFTLQDGQLMGKIVVSTPEAKALFDQNLGDLQRALQQAGLTMGNMDVSYNQDGNFSDTSAQNEKSVVGSLLMNNEESAVPEETAAFYRNDIYGSRINFLA